MTFIDEHSDRFAVALLLRVLQIGESTYYQWRKQAERPTRPAPDLVNRDFTANHPNRLWVADATRIPTGEGVFWLVTVRDVFSRRIVG
jgi:transposase InsO family protein